MAASMPPSGDTCYGPGSEELQRSQPALLVCKLGLEVGVRGEIDGREGDVSQETCFSTLKRHREDRRTHETVLERTMREGGKGKDTLPCRGRRSPVHGPR